MFVTHVPMVAIRMAMVMCAAPVRVASVEEKAVLMLQEDTASAVFWVFKSQQTFATAGMKKFVSLWLQETSHLKRKFKIG